MERGDASLRRFSEGEPIRYNSGYTSKMKKKLKAKDFEESNDNSDHKGITIRMMAINKKQLKILVMRN